MSPLLLAGPRLRRAREAGSRRTGSRLADGRTGRGAEGAERYASVSGSSASAAAVAGAAALSPKPAPSSMLGAQGSAGRHRSLARARSVAAQGAGMLDLGAALSAEAAVLPTTLSFDHAGAKNWQATRKLIVRNLSSRTLRLRIVADEQQNAAGRGLVFGALQHGSRLRPVAGRGSTSRAASRFRGPRARRSRDCCRFARGWRHPARAVADLLPPGPALPAR